MNHYNIKILMMTQINQYQIIYNMDEILAYLNIYIYITIIYSNSLNNNQSIFVYMNFNINRSIIEIKLNKYIIYIKL